MILPYQRFFEPTQKFLEWIEKQHKAIVDCGSGVGYLPSLYPNKAIGIDIHGRERCDSFVIMKDARIFPFEDKCICLIARPDHSGWIDSTIDNALNRNSQVVYVGLHNNIEIDLYDFKFEIFMENAGTEGEFACQITKKLI